MDAKEATMVVREYFTSIKKSNLCSRSEVLKKI